MKTGKKIIILMVLVFILLPVFVHAVSWLPLVPCGVSNDNPDTPQDETKPCNRCDLLRLLKNIIDFVLIGLMPPAAAILFVWGGFLILMGGANPGWISQGKDIFWNTAVGVAIILASWMITNTIIRSLAADNVAPEWWKFECRVTTATAPQPQPPVSEPGPGQPPLPEPGPGQPPIPQPQPPAPQPQPPLPPGPQPVPANLTITTSILSDARQDSNYSQMVQATGGKAPYNWSIQGSLPSGLTINGSTGEILGKPTTSGNFTVIIKVEDSSSTQKSATKQITIKVNPAGQELVCKFTGVNLCQASNRTPYNNQIMICSASACSQYVGTINKYAGGAASANLLKAIMIKESTCNKNADSGHAYGLMQLVPSTAVIYASRCGVANAKQVITPQWLKDNPILSICISAEYLKATSQTVCGSSIRNIAAGYNGGEKGACNLSVDCKNEKSCDGLPLKRWECLYDNPEHTICNDTRLGNYDETRDYAVKVLYCYNNPGF